MLLTRWGLVEGLPQKMAYSYYLRFSARNFSVAFVSKWTI